MDIAAQAQLSEFPHRIINKICSERRTCAHDSCITKFVCELAGPLVMLRDVNQVPPSNASRKENSMQFNLDLL
jgi:hypothetical protein